MHAPPPPPDRATPIIERTRLEELHDTAPRGEGAVLLRELLNIFCAEARLHFPQLARGCATGNSALARREAHFLAGSSANLGLARLAAWMRAVELRAHDGDWAPANGFDGLLHRELADACAAYEAAVTDLERR